MDVVEKARHALTVFDGDELKWDAWSRRFRAVLSQAKILVRFSVMVKIEEVYGTSAVGGMGSTSALLSGLSAPKKETEEEVDETGKLKKLEAKETKSGATAMSDDEISEYVYDKLILYTDDRPGAIVAEFDETRDGVAAWRALLRKYERSGQVQKATLAAKLSAEQLSNDEDPDTYFMRIEALYRRLKVLKYAIDDEAMFTNVLPQEKEEG